MKPEVAIYTVATGDIVVLAEKSAPLRTGQASVALPAGYDEEVHEWSKAARMMVESPAKLRAVLLAQVKADAETQKMGFLSPGGAKKAEYAQKAAEVAFFDSLGATVALALAALNALPAAYKQAKFGYAIADAAAFGDTVPAAIDRFRSGMANAAKVPGIAAVEAKTCTALKNATTPAALRAAVAGAVWPA